MSAETCSSSESTMAVPQTSEETLWDAVWFWVWALWRVGSDARLRERVRALVELPRGGGRGRRILNLMIRMTEESRLPRWARPYPPPRSAKLRVFKDPRTRPPRARKLAKKSESDFLEQW